VSPNEEVDLTVYPDAPTRRIARALLEAGDEFRFDLSDLQPVAFGATTGAGLWAELSAFVADPTDVEGTMARLELPRRRAAWATGDRSAIDEPVADEPPRASAAPVPALASRQLRKRRPSW
jgi:alpha-glucoside transport system substrate-binding protein